MAEIHSQKNIMLIAAAGALLALSLAVISLPFVNPQEIDYWLRVVLFLVVSLNALAFAFLFVDRQIVWLIFAVAAGLLVLILFPRHWLQIFSALSVTGGILEMRRSISKAKEQIVHFSYYEAVKKGMRALLTSLIFLLALNVYINTSENLKSNPEQFYRSIANTVVRGIEPVLYRQVEGFSSDMTLDDFLVKTDFVGIEGVQLMPDNSFNGDFSEARQRFFEIFGIQASGSEQVLNVMRQIVTERIKEILRPIEEFVPIIYALILFLSLRFILPVIVWITAGLGEAMYKIMIKAGWIKITERTITVKVPELS